jgi:nitrogen-specific signal transduction histidine kinase/ActR/RegA family two-component response regulator
MAPEIVDESSQRNEADPSAQSRQAQKMEAVGQLAGGLAHDFNNLLGIILGYCETLEEQAGLPPATLQIIGHIHHAGTSARNLTQRLLALSRQQALQPVVLDLNTAVMQMQTMFHGVVGPDVQLRCVLERGLGTIKADPTQVEQVLMNLVINARDAMPDGGKIAVETANVEIDPSQQASPPHLPAGQYVRLIVSDTGTGIDPEIQAHLFEPFCSSKPAGKGTGLGLSTVSTIVRKSGGAIDVSTRPGKGTVFTVYFPRYVEGALALQAGAAASVSGAETILLVDDATALRQLTRQMLEHSGYKVLDTGDPAEGLRLARECAGTLPLMITDLFMPGFSGTVLAEKLAPFRPETKVLYTSGYEDESMVQPGVRGVDYDFLLKPFTRDDLLRKVRALLDAPRMPARRPVRPALAGASSPMSFG